MFLGGQQHTQPTDALHEGAGIGAPFCTDISSCGGLSWWRSGLVAFALTGPICQNISALLSAYPEQSGSEVCDRGERKWAMISCGWRIFGFDRFLPQVKRRPLRMLALTVPLAQQSVMRCDGPAPEATVDQEAADELGCGHRITFWRFSIL